MEPSLIITKCKLGGTDFLLSLGGLIYNTDLPPLFLATESWPSLASHDAGGGMVAGSVVAGDDSWWAHGGMAGSGWWQYVECQGRRGHQVMVQGAQGEGDTDIGW